MKKKKETVILFALLISAVLIFIIIAACAAGKAKGRNKQLTESSAEETTTESADSFKDMRLSYYESELQRLEEELLTLKSDRFISDSKSQTKISELEKKIEELNNGNNTSNIGQHGKEDQLIHYTDSDITTLEEETTSYKSDETEHMKFDCIRSGERIVILAYHGNMKDVAIPSYIESQPVYEIGEDAFRGCDITSVTIPSTVTKIGKLAFFGCKDLKSITIPSSVQMIGIAAFDSCNSDFTIYCEKDSYAHKFAVSAGIKYEIID